MPQAQRERQGRGTFRTWDRRVSAADAGNDRAPLVTPAQERYGAAGSLIRSNLHPTAHNGGGPGRTPSSSSLRSCALRARAPWPPQNPSSRPLSFLSFLSLSFLSSSFSSSSSSSPSSSLFSLSSLIPACLHSPLFFYVKISCAYSTYPFCPVVRPYPAKRGGLQRYSRY